MSNNISEIPKYPVGIQSFVEIRKGGYVYVDKTQYVYDLISSGKYYFLSRPRRFGKSLLLSTLEAYYLGQRDLFKGLALYDLTDDWEPHPVLRVDFNTGEFRSRGQLEEMLASILLVWENELGIDAEKDGVSQVALRFKAVIEKAYRLTGKKVVILIDEYDKPLFSALHDVDLYDALLSLLKSFYSTLKTMDECIEFAMLTGVGRFGKLSVFSDLNNLRDISFVEQFSSICGITDQELVTYFDAGINRLALVTDSTPEEVREELKRRYDGYHFTPRCPDIYNPFSLLSTFADEAYDDYWFATGTPTYLVGLIRRLNRPVASLIPAKIQASSLKTASVDSKRIIPSLYQAGYLTIKGYHPEDKIFILDYPNQEVEEGLLHSLLLTYAPDADSDNGFGVSDFADAVRNGEPDVLMEKMQSLFASIGYSEKEEKEAHFQNIMQILLMLLGFYAGVEHRTSDGRIDLNLSTSRFVYLIELKVDKTAQDALDQIKEKQYWLPYAQSGKRVFLIGANFSKHSGRLTDWIVEELSPTL